MYNNIKLTQICPLIYNTVVVINESIISADKLKWVPYPPIGKPVENYSDNRKITV